MSTAPEWSRAPDDGTGSHAAGPDSPDSFGAFGGSGVPRDSAGGEAVSPLPRPVPSSVLIFDDPLDRPSPDETDRGWGERASDAADDDFTRFLNEKPPHHI